MSSDEPREGGVTNARASWLLSSMAALGVYVLLMLVLATLHRHLCEQPDRLLLCDRAEPLLEKGLWPLKQLAFVLPFFGELFDRIVEFLSS